MQDVTVCKSDTECRDVLSNAFLPGIYHGWGVRLFYPAPPKDRQLICLDHLSHLPGSMDFAPGLFEFGKRIHQNENVKRSFER